MDPAFGLIEIKSIDAEQRIIEGVASAISPDRVGHIMDPRGAEFNLPMPLLWQHAQDTPIGQVIAADVSDSGILVRAQLARIPEAGLFRDQIDKAWHAIKSGLVRGLSIGFLPTAMPILEGKFLRFPKWKWFETSAVTIPAHQEASILVVKHLTEQAAKFGQDARSSSLAGASAQGKKDAHPMNPSDQITTLSTERTTLAERMKSLMAPVLEQTGDLDANQQQEYDTAATRLKTIDTTISRLQAYEQSQMAIAKSISHQVGDFAGASQARDFQSIGNPTEPKLPPGIEFARYAICKVAGRMFGMNPVEVAKMRYPSNQRVHMMLKAAVAGGTTTDATWASPLVATPGTLVAEFLEFLRPMTLLGRIPGITRVPFNVRIQSQTSGGSAGWVGQGKLKPVTKFDYADVNLYWFKLAALAVLADELIRFSSPSAEARVRDALAAAVIERMDIDLIDPTNAGTANVKPASITYGISALTSAGNAAADVRSDFAQALSQFAGDNLRPTGLVVLMPETMALQISMMTTTLGTPEFPSVTMNGGTLGGVPIVTSQYLNIGGSPANNLVIFVHAPSIFLADDGGVDIVASNEASVEMSSDPENESGTVVSMFQSNQVAIRAERYVNWKRGRDEAVQYYAGVAYDVSAT